MLEVMLINLFTCHMIEVEPEGNEHPCTKFACGTDENGCRVCKNCGHLLIQTQIQVKWDLLN